MPAIIATRANVYTGSLLDRAAARREDAAWIAAARDAADTLWVPVWRGQHLIAGGTTAVLLTGEAASALRHADAPWAFLGLLEGRPLFAIDVGGQEQTLSVPDGLKPGWAFAELRGAVGVLPEAEAALLAHARGLMYWRARHRFCGHCGGAASPRSGGNVLLCETCGTQHFPRTDPAVIMLVVHQDRALLAHSQRFPTPTMYSTLAGFVEPGESLEEAVAREVYEEAGVQVHDVTYHSSQPWPFPASLMVGFHAQAADDRIAIDGDELTDARWFSRAEIRDPQAHGFMIPGADSIARRLIEDWMDQP